MSEIIQIIKNEFSGWKLWETSWLLFGTLIILIISSLLHYDLISLIAAVTGVISVICSGKGKLSGFIFGIINALLYAFISFNSHYYGEMLLNIFYFVPISFYGLYIWNKNMNKDTHEVNKKNLNHKQHLKIAVIIIIFTIIYGIILLNTNDNRPFLDAFCSITTIITMMLAVKMYVENWILWILVNGVRSILWLFLLLEGVGNIPILLMCIVYLLNSIIMYIKWNKEINLTK